MNWRIFSSTHESDRSGDRVVRDAHMWLPGPGGDPRLFCVRVEILNAPRITDCRATVSVLTPGYAWAEILSVPATEWRHRVPMPTGSFNDSKYPLDHYAAGMFSTAHEALRLDPSAALADQPAETSPSDKKRGGW